VHAVCPDRKAGDSIATAIHDPLRGGKASMFKFFVRAAPDLISWIVCATEQTGTGTAVRMDNLL
jgi:hypothetical protein